MKVYQNLKHQDINQICNICGKQTATSVTLKEHQDTVHEGYRLKCTEWDQKAHSQRNLNQKKKERNVVLKN